MKRGSRAVECLRYLFHSHAGNKPVWDWDIIFFSADDFKKNTKPVVKGYTVSRFSQKIYNEYPDNPILPFKCYWVGEKRIQIKCLQK